MEISRALKSSESMLPVCFCSQDAGIAEASPEQAPCAQWTDRTMEKQGARRPRDQVRESVQRHEGGGKRARRQHRMSGVGGEREGEGEKEKSS